MFSDSKCGGRAPAIAAAVILCSAWGATAADPGTEDVRVSVGKSIVIDYPEDIGRISTSNPEVVDAVAVSTREVLLHAKSLGISTVVIWSKGGQRTFYNMTVEPNLAPLRQLLAATFPSESIQVQAARDSITLTGQVSSKETSDRVTALAASQAKTVVNNLSVRPTPVDKQIMLRVKFAELDRRHTKEFGVNLLSTGALNTPGIVTTGQFTPPRPTGVQGVVGAQTTGTRSEFNLTDALNVFAFRPDLNLASAIKALQGQGILQILAEPNLVTTNGKEASFLVGGEFPIPILQGGANSGAVTIQFREFGIRLTFTPQLTPHETLKMFVRPEVSAIDIANSVNVGGFRIPALSTRRIESNIELAPGQSFVIGGLIDDRADETFSRIPGLANIPLLGAIFRSRFESRAQTELIVLVTPDIVDPLAAAEPKPLPDFPLPFLEAPKPSVQRPAVTAPPRSNRRDRSGPSRKEVAAVGPAAAAPLPEPAAAGAGDTAHVRLVTPVLTPADAAQEARAIPGPAEAAPR